MQISLHSILIHESFDWTCRGSKAALLENIEVVVKEMAEIETVATDSSSSLYKATFDKQMTANVHLLVAHGVLYLKWAQDEVGVPLGILTEGSIEKCNQDVKQANSSFVARTLVENIHRNVLVRRSWEADPVLHYEGTVMQVMLSTVAGYHNLFVQ